MAGHIASEPSRVQNGAWWTLASSMSLMLIAGTIYGFGAWSPALAEAYSLGQGSIDMLAVASHLGNYLVLDSGFLTAKFGTVFGMFSGCLYACAGYTFLYFSVEVFPGQVPFWCLVAACFVFGHGCGTIDNAVMTQALADFKEYKGYANGCIKAYFGLATATVATIYTAVFKPNQSDFLLFLGVYSGICALTLVPVVAFTKGMVAEPVQRVKSKFTLLTVGIVAFAFYFFVVQLEQEHISTTWWRCILVSVGLGMASLFLLPLRSPSCFQRQPATEQDPADAGASESTGSEAVVQSAPAREVSGMQMLGHMDFWLFVFVCIVGQGVGLMFLSNAAQILPALVGHESNLQTALVATISVFNSLARLIFGSLSEMLRGKIARSWFLVAAILLLMIGYMILWVAGQQFLWIGAIFVGFGYGGLSGVQPTMIGELFGMSDYSFKYACSAAAAAIGSLVFNEGVAVPIFEMNAAGQPEFPKCFSSVCFDTSFLVAICACLPAIFVAVFLARRSRWIYAEASSEASHVGSVKDEECGAGTQRGLKIVGACAQ